MVVAWVVMEVGVMVREEVVAGVVMVRVSPEVR